MSGAAMYDERSYLNDEPEHLRMQADSTGGIDPEVQNTLATRHAMVSDLTQLYYRGDVIPPSTKSQILRAQKFSVYYYYTMNAVFFLYGFIIPLIISPSDPYFGGSDPRRIRGKIAKLSIIGVTVAVCLIRFVVMSWKVEFYQFGVLLASLEVALCAFTAIFWSPGLPMLLTLLFANLLNVCVCQYYWKFHFTEIVTALPSLVPPVAHWVRDTTSVSVWDPQTLYLEFAKLWGFKKTKTPAQLYDERCGVFSTKDNVSHVEALHRAYMQALEPRSRWVPWNHIVSDLFSLNFLGLLDGLLNTFCTNASVAFSGFWLGEVLFRDFYHGGYAIMVAVLITLLYLASIRRTLGWLEEALGVAVAEKEWLAHDVVKHTAQRDEMLFDVVDVMGTSTSRTKMVGPDFMQKGRLNMVFMWLCVASTADFVGESLLAKMYWNLAHETRSMMEALTPYDFKLFPHAKWEVTHKGVAIKIIQTFLLAFMSCLYFGTYYENLPVPVPAMAILGAACFIQSVVKLTEAVQFSFSILAGNVQSTTTHRHMFVSESIVFVAFVFVVINVLIWLYLLPIMKHWDLPVGSCQETFNAVLFPSACLGKTSP